MKRNKTISIETDYSELSVDKFCQLSAVIFNNNSIALSTLRIQILEVLTQLDLNSEKANCSQFVAELTAFVFKITHNPDILNLLTTETRNLLKYCHPTEINDKKAIADLKPKISLLHSTVDFNYNLKTNPISQLIINNTPYHGPVFEIDNNGILTTNLVAGEWIDACEYMNYLTKTGNLEYLKNIAACLYRPSGELYDTHKAQQRAKLFDNTPDNTLKGIWFVFRAIQKFFIAYPSFSVLFNTNSSAIQTGTKINIGSAELLYQICKDGYGTLENITNMPIIDFFNIQVKNIRDAINSLRSINQSNKQIALSLKMDIETVLKF